MKIKSITTKNKDRFDSSSAQASFRYLEFTDRAYSRKWRYACDFSERGQKNAKKGQNIWKFGQKCTKFENVLKKGRWLCAIIARNELLEKTLLIKLYPIHLWSEFILLNNMYCYFCHLSWKKENLHGNICLKKHACYSSPNLKQSYH